MNVKIKVTQDDIDNGNPRQRCDCPLWHAIRRSAPYLRDLAVVYVYIICRDRSGEFLPVPLPDAASNFIANFDAGLTVYPFRFDLDIPDDLIPAEVAR